MTLEDLERAVGEVEALEQYVSRLAPPKKYEALACASRALTPLRREMGRLREAAASVDQHIDRELERIGLGGPAPRQG